MKKPGTLPRCPLARGSGPRPAPMRRKRRTVSEFNRIYGSRARARWIKDLPCWTCLALSPFLGLASAGRSHNAHTVSGGKGRKADHDTIVPLCAAHHRRYDEHKAPFDTEVARQAIKDAAPEVHRLWLAHVGAAAA